MAGFTIKGWFDEDRLQAGVLCGLPEVRECPVKKQLHGFRNHLRTSSEHQQIQYMQENAPEAFSLPGLSVSLYSVFFFH